MPASPDLLRVARLTAAGLANRVGFNVDEVEDVKIALDELCFSLLGEGTGALLALPLVASAARALREVATFDSAGVTEKA